jgi:NAD(P)-dependent dehydrogenase (short-subunit alcohol dehydrogenase family)
MFANKVIIVTGSSTGIGAGTALKFVELGAAAVVLHGRNVDALKNMKEQCEKAGQGKVKVHVVVGDVTDPEVREKLIKETVDKFGRLDVLVNNVGFCNVPKTIVETPIEVFDKIMDVNIRSAIVLTQLAIPHLVQAKGSIVNVSSVGGIKALNHFTYYGMSKAAMDHFTRCLAVELGPKGVRVHSVNPGAVPETEIMSRESGTEIIKEHVNQLVHVTPLRRVGRVEEIANLITFLASDNSSFITGIRAVADGGLILV